MKRNNQGRLDWKVKGDPGSGHGYERRRGELEYIHVKTCIRIYHGIRRWGKKIHMSRQSHFKKKKCEIPRIESQSPSRTTTMDKQGLQHISLRKAIASRKPVMQHLYIDGHVCRRVDCRGHGYSRSIHGLFCGSLVHVHAVKVIILCKNHERRHHRQHKHH